MKRQPTTMEAPPRVPEGSYTTLQVSLMSGASLRQLQWWDDHGILCPPVVAHMRLYTANEASNARRIVQLRKAGVSLKQVRNLLSMEYEHVRKIRVPTVIGSTLVIPTPRKHQ